MKECIICHCQFKSAPPEHVIPKAIGGQYTVHNVCKECNTLMNKNIDEPFKDNPFISTYRFKFGIKGRTKGTSNPLKGKKVVIDGEERLLELNEKLEVKAKSKPQFPKLKDLKFNSEFKITIDEEDIHLVDDYLNKAAKYLKIPRTELNLGEISKQYVPKSKVKIPFESNEVLLEYSKILYQTSCDLLGSRYIESKSAKKYAEMIHSGRINADMRELITPQESIVNEVYLQLQNNASHLEESHVIAVCGYLGLGLIGFLKIFNHSHVLILSNEQKFDNTSIHFIVNDHKSRKLTISRQRKIPTCNVTIDGKYVSGHVNLDAELKGNNLSTEYPVFGNNDELICNCIFDLVNDLRFHRQISTNFSDRLNITVFTFNLIFIKSKTMKLCLPIESVTFICQQETLKSR